MRVPRDHRGIVGVVMLALVSTACGSVGDQSTPDLQPRVVLIVHVGDADPGQIRGDVRDLVMAAAHDGARLEVYALDSGSAASMSQVVLSDEANGGNFVLTGGNQRYRDQEALRYADLVMRDLDALFDTATASPTGADVIGAIVYGVAAVDRLPGDGSATVSLITGGGVHRTRALDLVAEEVSPENAAEVASRVEPLAVPAGVVVEVRGVGRFEGAIPPVDPQFAQGVRMFWEVLCPSCRFH
ncbi:MAG: hypothetical protein ACRD07_18740 [Acidimicrobiales bacterium]